MTFHRAINYGAVLQAYALRRYIKDTFDIGCDVIDYRCADIESMYGYSGKRLSLKTGLKRMFSARKTKAFEDFLINEIEIGKSVQRSMLGNEADKYDIIITGSDQVWGSPRIGKDEAYFLDFVNAPAKKASYAASMGSGEIEERFKDKYKALLEDFAFLSVREQKAGASLYKLLGRQAEVSIDPTLLLRRKEWAAVASDRFKGNRYVLIYTLTDSPSVIAAAKRIADERRLKIYNISDSYHSEKGIRNLRFLSPGEWVGAFMNAEYIVTNSFHGTAFAINFNVDFNTEVTGAIKKRGTRITDILRLFGLENRLIEGSRFDSGKIDYMSANRVLVHEQNRSEAYLKSVFLSVQGDNNDKVV